MPVTTLYDKTKPANPYVMKIGLKSLGSNAEKVFLVENEFQEALRAHTEDMNLMYETWDAYFSINNGQWERSKLLKLKAEDRDARSFDIIGPKVDTLAGSLIAELPDMDWLPIEGGRTSLTESLRESWYDDKELTNSEYELMLAIRDGLVHIGWVQLVECRKYGKPVIGLKRIMPGFFIPSAYWIQESDRDMEVGFKTGYLTPDQLKFKFKAKSVEIDEAIRLIRTRGHQELPSNAYDMRRRYIGRIADHYQVIEKHWVDHVETSRLVGAKIDNNTGNVKFVPFPITTDRQQLEHFAAVNEVEWETVEEVPYTDDIHRVDTIVPDLDRSIVLEDGGKSKLQPKGLPFYHFTTSRFNGRNKGVVAAMLDPQRTINERESLVTELISKANGGSDLVDENIFKDDKDRERFIKNSNKPGYKHFGDFSQSKHGTPVIKVGSNQYPSQVLDQIDRMWQTVFPMVSRVSDSMSAITESGKSGVLFDREIQINRIGNLLMDKGIKRLMDHIGEGYYFQYPITYAGIEREITSRDGGRKIKINERYVDDSGRPMIKNAVAHMPLCKTLVTESTSSATYQMRYRFIYNDLLKEINPETNLEHYNFVFNKFMATLDLPEKDKAELEALNRMMETKSKMRFVQDITGIHAGTKVASLEAANADMQLMQIMGQMQALGIQGQAQPAIPEQINDATDDVVQPAGPEQGPVPAAGSDVEEFQT
jgi:hypothetical protein